MLVHHNVGPRGNPHSATMEVHGNLFNIPPFGLEVLIDVVRDGGEVGTFVVHLSEILCSVNVEP